jgi:CheY-like chemotaxis protein
MLRALLPATMTLEVRSDPAVPAAAIDVVELEQVLLNLAVNARDALGQHGRLALHLTEADLIGEACASCGAILEGHYVEIACGDDGPGIPDEVRSRIFEPFFTTKPAGIGTGMGLAVVHGAVHRWGGHLLLATGSSGTAVRLMLPPADAVLPSEPVRALMSPAVPFTAARDLQVAIVDDERSIAHLIAEILETRGFRCVQFENSVQALGALLAEPTQYDLVITDFGMPDLTGEELVAELRAAGRDLPAVLCSGTPGVLNEDRARQLDIHCVLPKPLTPEQLVNAVAAAVRCDSGPSATDAADAR